MHNKDNNTDWTAIGICFCFAIMMIGLAWAAAYGSVTRTKITQEQKK